LIREDIAAADRRRIGAAFNRLAAVYTFYNFGADLAPPLFQFVKDEDLQSDRAERDTKLHQLGWRPKKEYFIREYGMQEEDFDLAEEPSGSGSFPGFSRGYSRTAPERKHPESCSCGCQGLNKKRSFFQKLFVSRDEKAKARAAALMGEFAESQLKAGQKEIDKTIELIADALGSVETYEDASAAIAEALKQRDCSGFARRIDEIRYVAQVLGEGNG
jgi:hypothetical protein